MTCMTENYMSDVANNFIGMWSLAFSMNCQFVCIEILCMSIYIPYLAVGLTRYMVAS